jgi:N-methylhydantoinase B
MAAHAVGERRLQEIVDTYGLDETLDRMAALLAYAERITLATLRMLPPGQYTYVDYLDDDGVSEEPVKIALRLTLNEVGELHCDFTGSSSERPGSINAVEAVTRSACYYAVRCLLDDDAPTNEGVFRPVTFTLPDRSVVNAGPPHAVSAGNVETSQRITDAMLGALAQALPSRIPAASAGTMNNVIIGGWDPFRRRHFTYYETVAGGAGAGREGEGLSAVQTHMTNTLNTPIEALEQHYPFRVRQYAVRSGSGGRGVRTGGDGVVRMWEFLAPATVIIISERRRFAPWGLAGGADGRCGRNRLIRSSGEAIDLPGKTEIPVSAGDRLVIETPGGGGWGAAS